MPDQLRSAKWQHARETQCPFCGAGIQQPCREQGQYPEHMGIVMHPERYRVSREIERMKTSEVFAVWSFLLMLATVIVAVLATCAKQVFSS